MQMHRLAYTLLFLVLCCCLVGISADRSTHDITRREHTTSVDLSSTSIVGAQEASTTHRATASTHFPPSMTRSDKPPVESSVEAGSAPSTESALAGDSTQVVDVNVTGVNATVVQVSSAPTTPVTSAVTNHQLSRRLGKTTITSMEHSAPPPPSRHRSTTPSYVKATRTSDVAPPTTTMEFGPASRESPGSNVEATTQKERVRLMRPNANISRSAPHLGNQRNRTRNAGRASESSTVPEVNFETKRPIILPVSKAPTIDVVDEEIIEVKNNIIQEEMTRHLESATSENVSDERAVGLTDPTRNLSSEPFSSVEDQLTTSEVRLRHNNSSTLPQLGIIHTEKHPASNESNLKVINAPVVRNSGSTKHVLSPVLMRTTGRYHSLETTSHHGSVRPSNNSTPSTKVYDQGRQHTISGNVSTKSHNGLHSNSTSSVNIDETPPQVSTKQTILNFHSAIRMWGPAWYAHVYSTGILFVVLTCCCIVAVIRIAFVTHLLRVTHLLLMLAFIFSFSFLRSLYLLFDPYLSQGRLPPIAARSLVSLPMFGSSGAFLVLFYALLDTTHVRLLPAHLQSAMIAFWAVILQLTVTVVSDVASALEWRGGQQLWLLWQLQMASWQLLLCLAFWRALRPLVRAARRLHADTLRQTVAKLQIEGSAMPRRLPRTTVGLAVRLAMVASLLAALSAVLRIGGLVWLYDISAVIVGGHGAGRSPPPRAWNWWSYQLACRVVEWLELNILLYSGCQPLRRHEPHPPAAAAGTGSCRRLMRLLGRAVHSASSTLRPKPSHMVLPLTESDYFPVVCSHNQVVQDASHDGRLWYDDRLTVGTARALSASASTANANSRCQRQVMRHSFVGSAARTPHGSRPSSFLLAPLPSPPVPPPPPPEPYIVWPCRPQQRQQRHHRQRDQRRRHFDTVRSNGTQTSDEYTDVYRQLNTSACPSPPVPPPPLFLDSPPPPPAPASSMRSTSAGDCCSCDCSSTSGQDTQYDAASSVWPPPTPLRHHHRRHADAARSSAESPCSSESASHSFDVRLYQHAEKNGSAHFRHRWRCKTGSNQQPGQRGTVGVECASTGAAGFAAGSANSLDTANYLTDVSPMQSPTHQSGSEVLFGRHQLHAASCTTPDASHAASFSLALPSERSCDTVSEDITPDSGVVADYTVDGECSRFSVQCSDARGVPLLNDMTTRSHTSPAGNRDNDSISGRIQHNKNTSKDHTAKSTARKDPGVNYAERGSRLSMLLRARPFLGVSVGSLLERLAAGSLTSSLTSSLHVGRGGYHSLADIDTDRRLHSTLDCSSSPLHSHALYIDEPPLAADKTTQTDFSDDGRSESDVPLVSTNAWRQRRRCRSHGDGLQQDVRLVSLAARPSAKV